MSDSTYYDAWVADGKPWRLCAPVKEIASKIKTALPGVNPVSVIGTIGDSAHLLADRPEDHTPYSRTGWPLSHPYPNITAIDLMHRPDLGLDCGATFAHWLSSAKAGRLPWLKYVIWQAKRYDVRNNWAPVSASGHYDHMHGSVRTDHIGTSIGSWHPLPGMDDDMEQSEALINKTGRPGRTVGEVLADLSNLRDALIGGGVVAPGMTGWPQPGSPLHNLAQLPDLLAGLEVPVNLSDAQLLKVADLAAEAVLAKLLPALDTSAIATRVAEQMRPEVRDAVADGLEGGSAQVRGS